MNKINVTKWKEFKITDLFDWHHGKRRARNDLNLVNFSIESDLVGYLTAGQENQGIIGSCLANNFKNEHDAVFNHSITIDMFGNSFYHEYPCAGDDNIYFLINNNYSDKQMLFLTSVISSITRPKFDYNNQFRKKDLQRLIIKLPVSKQNQPDWQYMDEYISKLATQAQQNLSSLRELKPQKHTINTQQWKKFKVEDLFNVNSSKKKFNAKSVVFNGNYPYIARGTSTNGIRGYIDEDHKYLNPANTISFGQDTATLYYQEKPYFTGDKIQILSLKSWFPKLDEYVAQFLITSMNIAFSTYTWGVQSFAVDKIRDVSFKLPVTANNAPDWQYMRQSIIRIQKNVKFNLNTLAKI